jgi:hypothetical protein
MAALMGPPLVLGLVSGGALMLVAGIEPSSFSRLGEPMARLQTVLNGDFLDMYHHLYAHLKAYRNPWYVWKTGSFAEKARHYLPLIYLISLTEALAKNLFLLYTIPLWVGFKRSALTRGHGLLLGLSGTYFLVVYYFLFTHDFISKRYLLVPALLLYPWTGRGLKMIWAGIAKCRWPRIAMVLFLLFFCGVPAYKSLRDVVGPDKGGVLRDTGQWLSMQSQLQNAVVACSDPRVRFYSSGNFQFIRQMEDGYVAQDLLKMESVAIENGADLLVVEISRKRAKHIPAFDDFALLKKFQDNFNNVLIYQRKNAPGDSAS